jgi:DNA-directed RNA polymerase subunit K/omega
MEEDLQNTEVLSEDEDIFEQELPENIIDNNFDINDYDVKNNITKPILNKYEISTILIMRCEQINNGMQPLIQNYGKFDNIEDIVEEELKQKKIPFIIKRNLRNSIDYWRLSDMSLQ